VFKLLKRTENVHYFGKNNEHFGEITVE